MNNSFYRLKCRIVNIPPLYYLIPMALILSAILIRLFSGGSVLNLNYALKMGLFPGSVMYTLGYTLRIVLSGVITAHMLSDDRCCRKWSRLLSAAIISLLLLTEYKLIFVSIRLFTAFLLSVVCDALAFYLMIDCRKQGKAVFCLNAVLFVLQLIFTVQLISFILSV